MHSFTNSGEDKDTQSHWLVPVNADLTHVLAHYSKTNSKNIFLTFHFTSSLVTLSLVVIV